ELAGNGLGGVDRLCGRTRNAPGRPLDAVYGVQLLGMVFVEVHVELLLGRFASRDPDPEASRLHAAAYSRPCAASGQNPPSAAAAAGPAAPLYTGTAPARARPCLPSTQPPQPSPCRPPASCTCSRCSGSWWPPCWRWWCSARPGR